MPMRYHMVIRVNFSQRESLPSRKKKSFTQSRLQKKNSRLHRDTEEMLETTEDDVVPMPTLA